MPFPEFTDADDIESLGEEVARLNDILADHEKEVETYKDMVKKLREELRTAYSESISSRCRRMHYQACHFCENLECGDNMSEAKKRIQELELAYAALNRVTVLLSDENEALRGDK